MHFDEAALGTILLFCLTAQYSDLGDALGSNSLEQTVLGFEIRLQLVLAGEAVGIAAGWAEFF